MGVTKASELINDLKERGFCDPFPLIGKNEARLCVDEAIAAADQYPQFSQTKSNPAYTLEVHWDDIAQGNPWFKSFHSVCPSIKELALHPEILNLVHELFGPSIALWSSQVISKGPGEDHMWHVDIEARHWPSVNVWVGLQNTNESAGLKLLSHSHKEANKLDALGQFVDQSDDKFEDQAQRLDETLQVMKPIVKPGEAILFFGRSWHGSFNVGKSIRRSLLLQYSPDNAMMRIPMGFSDPIKWHRTLPDIVKSHI